MQPLYPQRRTPRRRKRKGGLGGRLTGSKRPCRAAVRTVTSSHVWTAPCWQGISERCRTAGRSCHMFGLLMRHFHMAAGHNALRRSGPGQKHAVSMLQWLLWGVPISGSTGWVHYLSVALSNLGCASLARADLKRPGLQARCIVCRGPSWPRRCGRSCWPARWLRPSSVAVPAAPQATVAVCCLPAWRV